MPEPIAKWNSKRDVWERTETPIFGPLDVYSETFPTSGMTLNGVAYELPTWEHRTEGSESLSLLHDGRNLPTPTTRDHKDHMIRREPHRPDSEDTLPRALVVTLLPTVTTSESTGAGNGPNKTGGDNLRTVITLLPTPKASDGMMGTPSTSGRPVEGSTFLATQVMLQQGHLEHRRLSGAGTSLQSDDGNKLWEDVPLPLLSQAATEATDSAHASASG